MAPGPFELSFIQILLSSIIVGFTRSGSLYRLAALPILLAFVYGIVSTARLHVRSGWASLFGSNCCVFWLQYLDLAILSRWDFESNGPSVKLPPDSEREITDTGTERCSEGHILGASEFWMEQYVVVAASELKI